MITCKDISETASDYLEGPMTTRRRLAYRLHLLMCKHCRRFIRQFHLTIGTIQRSNSKPEPDDSVIDDLVDQLKRYGREN